MMQGRWQAWRMPPGQPGRITCETLLHSSTWLTPPGHLAQSTWLPKQHSNRHLLILVKLSQADWARGVGRRRPCLPLLKRFDAHIPSIFSSEKGKISEKVKRPGWQLLAWAARSSFVPSVSRGPLNMNLQTRLEN